MTTIQSFSRRVFLHLTGAAGVTGAVALTGLPALQDVDWTLTGEWRETCSCNMHCPCWMGIQELMVMDAGYCGSTNLLRIKSGSSNGVDLGGTALIAAVLWPGPTLFDGNGTGRLYIDETADEDQRRELETIFQGTRGGPMEILASLTPTWLPTEVVTIEVTEEDEDTVMATVDPFGQIVSHRLRSGEGEPMTIQNVGFTVALQFDDQTGELAPGDGTEWSDPDMPEQWVSKSGTIGQFTWTMNQE